MKFIVSSSALLKQLAAINGVIKPVASMHPFGVVVEGNPVVFAGRNAGQRKLHARWITDVSVVVSVAAISGSGIRADPVCDNIQVASHIFFE